MLLWETIRKTQRFLRPCATLSALPFWSSCAAAQSESSESAVSIKVLGSGCAKCGALEDAVRAALTELGITAEIEHVTDFAQIAAYGVMTTPALVVDGKVVSYGRVLKKGEAKAVIQTARADT